MVLDSISISMGGIQKRNRLVLCERTEQKQRDGWT